jgi:ribose-phosphate pyrophosphokinase
MAVKVIGWPAMTLARDLAVQLDCEAAALDVHQFPDGESLVRLPLDIEGHDVVIAANLDHPNGKVLPLLFAADAASELGAHRVLLVAPYLPYMRQDIRFHPREAVSSRTFARMLSSSFDVLVTVDPHLHRWANLSQLYTIPAKVVPAAPAIASWISAHVESPLVVGPDEESSQWASEVARLADAPHVVMRKTRRGDRDVSVALADPLPPGVRTPVLEDDIVSTGHTLMAAARALRDHRLAPPVAVCVHALFDEPTARHLHECGMTRIVSCDTVPHASNAITLIPTIAAAVRQFVAA